MNTKMTIQKAIDLARMLKEDDFTDEIKTEWLYILDAKIKAELIDTHDYIPRAFRRNNYQWKSPIDYYPTKENYPNNNDGRLDLPPYSAEEKSTTELIVPYPYAELYPRYLIMKAEETYGDPAYNSSAALFNAQYLDFCKWYNRNYESL